MIDPVLLQTLTDKLAGGRLFQVVIDVFTSALPLPIVAALVFLPIGAAYYIVQRSVIIPVIMTIMVGGATIAVAPAGYSAALVALLVLALGGAVYILLQRVSVTQ
ncbi:MAG: hypothetical protein V5A22_07225 [Salinivenus sp.]